VRFEVPTNRLAFTDRDLTRVVEPGDVEVWVAASAGEKVANVVAEGIAEISDVEVASAAGESGVDKALVTVTGDVHRVGTADRRITTATVSR
jgi:beta-glucosidase